MALLTLNGVPVIEATITLPRVGVWHADLKVDTSTDVTGPGVLATNDGSFSLKGVSKLHGVFLNTLSVRVVGGAGGLAQPVGPKSYQGVPLRLVAQDLLTACGETLSPASDAGVLNTPLAKWTRLASPVAEYALQRLLDPIATSWRILPDGTLWIGTDTYPAAPNVPFDVMQRYFGEGRVVLGMQQPFLLPGVTLTISISATQGTQQVSAVVYHILPESIRAEVWFEKPTS